MPPRGQSPSHELPQPWSCRICASSCISSRTSPTISGSRADVGSSKQHHVRVHGQEILQWRYAASDRRKACPDRNLPYPEDLHRCQKLQCRFFRASSLLIRFRVYRCEHNILFYCLMWKKIKLLEYHSDLLTVTVDVHLRSL